MHKKFVIYSSTGQKEEVHITGKDFRNACEEAYAIFEWMKRNSNGTVEMGIETWLLLESNKE